MRLEKRDTEAFYLGFRDAASFPDPDLPSVDTVEETLELDEGVYMDLDAQGRVVGLEFLGFDDFSAFLKKHRGFFTIPERVEDTTALRPTRRG